jgi:hypothetical protein
MRGLVTGGSLKEDAVLSGRGTSNVTAGTDVCSSNPVAVDSRCTQPAVLAADHTVSVPVRNSGASYSVGIAACAEADSQDTKAASDGNAA